MSSKKSCESTVVPSKYWYDDIPSFYYMLILLTKGQVSQLCFYTLVPLRRMELQNWQGKVADPIGLIAAYPMKWRVSAAVLLNLSDKIKNIYI